ncbi:hypothetical protein LP418_09970 [Nocardioides sp. B-3]|nr:nitrilase-related carbon-nitrogen hydrolase [Nocardioides sp. B-3]UUZ61639.1 hypothetical protein LP418_09970 [Nocardioides sp. B-3]
MPAARVAGDRKVDHWRTLVRARAIENTVHVIAVGQPGPRYCGHSMVVDPLGDVLVEAGPRRRRPPDAVPGPRGARRGTPDQPLPRKPTAVASSPCPRPPKVPPRALPRDAGSRRSPPRTAGRRSRPSPPGRRSSPGPEKQPRTAPFSPRIAGIAGAAVLVAGLVALSCAVAAIGPDWIDGAGAIAVSTVLSAAPAHRTGGRPGVALLLAPALGLVAVVIGTAPLQTGAAVLTVVVGGVYAVMATVPAVSFWEAAREVLIATLIAGFAAIAAVGFRTHGRRAALRLRLARAGPRTRVRRGLPPRRGHPRARPPRHGRGARRCRRARPDPGLRRAAASVRRRVGRQLRARLRCVDRRSHRRLPAPARRLPRHPRPALGLLPARSPSPGLVGVRLRRDRHRSAGPGAPRPGRLVPRGGPAWHLLPRPRAADRLPPGPPRPGLHRPARSPRSQRRGGRRAPARTLPLRRALNLRS